MVRPKFTLLDDFLLKTSNMIEVQNDPIFPLNYLAFSMVFAQN